jgi:hypothetical protein
LHLGSFDHGIEVPEDRKSQRDQRTGAQALNGPEEDEFEHGLRLAGEGRTEQEEADAGHVEEPSAVKIGQPAPDRHGYR